VSIKLWRFVEASAEGPLGIFGLLAALVVVAAELRSAGGERRAHAARKGYSLTQNAGQRLLGVTSKVRLT
jgi:hypothetical protein